jgi:hypothetical protein
MAYYLDTGREDHIDHDTHVFATLDICTNQRNYQDGLGPQFFAEQSHMYFPPSSIPTSRVPL